jgi:hypothetical protein
MDQTTTFYGRSNCARLQKILSDRYFVAGKNTTPPVSGCILTDKKKADATVGIGFP